MEWLAGEITGQRQAGRELKVFLNLKICWVQLRLWSTGPRAGGIEKGKNILR